MDKNNLKINCPKCFKTRTENTLKYYHNTCEGKPSIRQRQTIIIHKSREEQDKQTDIIEINSPPESVKNGACMLFSPRCC